MGQNSSKKIDNANHARVKDEVMYGGLNTNAPNNYIHHNNTIDTP